MFNKVLACFNKFCPLFLRLFKAYSTFFVHKHAAVKRCVFKVSQLVALIVLRLFYGICAKQAEFSPFFNAVIVFVVVAVINNRVYKARFISCNFKYNFAFAIKSFGNNLAKVHVAVNFGKVNAARRISVNCTVAFITICNIAYIAVNKQPTIFFIAANVATVGLQVNAITFYSITVCTNIAVQQAAFGSDGYITGTGTYVVNINILIFISCHSLNVNIAACSCCFKVQRIAKFFSI